MESDKEGFSVPGQVWKLTSTTV